LDIYIKIISYIIKNNTKQVAFSFEIKEDRYLIKYNWTWIWS